MGRGRRDQRMKGGEERRRDAETHELEILLLHPHDLGHQSFVLLHQPLLHDRFGSELITNQ